MRRVNRVKANLLKNQAVLIPSIKDIAWAAGLYEGEGHCSCTPTHKSGYTVRIAITQKDPEVLFRMKKLFGGTIQRKGNTCSLWQAGGVRGRGIAFTLFSFLTQRRRQQIITALQKEL